ncbi:HTH marR-type domain-containing protein [Deinococcus saxicola]|uniref:MarR family winged helix-turn-helix transcriptional regulator n=1 Tax=Deinococcus saxicola TaxID=249406 RepID=UPI0039EF1CE3
MDDLLASRLCTALMRVGTRMATGFDQHFGAVGLTQAQFRFLLAVWEEGGRQGVSPSVLARHLLIERGTVSVLASVLVKTGLIERLPGENRRSHLLVLTRRGGELLQSAVPRAVTLADHTLADLDPAQRLALRAALDTIETTLRNWTPLEEPS